MSTGGHPPVSVLLLAYQQQGLVRAALESLLAQEGEPLEIIASDDASTDGTHEEIVRTASAYRGPHRVVARRNEVNLGIGAHLNALVACSHGELLVTAAGDDLSEPSRVRELVSAWRQGGKRADLIASHLTDMDFDGRCGGIVTVDDLSQWTSAHAWTAQRPRVIGAAQAWTRRMFDRFGPLDPGIAYEDQVFAFRALSTGGGITLPRPLVRYRRGGTSARGRTETPADQLRRIGVQNGRHLAELRQMRADAERTDWREAVAPYLDAELRKQRYVSELMSAPGGRERLASMLGAAGVPWSWRWRKFWQVGRAAQRAAGTG